MMSNALERERKGGQQDPIRTDVITCAYKDPYFSGTNMTDTLDLSHDFRPPLASLGMYCAKTRLTRDGMMGA